MTYFAIYLYLMGSTTIWWFARSTERPVAAKVLAVLLWPILIPAAALWG
jgi:hypothetical protein